MSTYAIKATSSSCRRAAAGRLSHGRGRRLGAWQADEPSCEIKDYTGSWIAPGMVDTHIHGFYNHSTTDNDPEGIDISSTELARRGTTQLAAHDVHRRRRADQRRLCCHRPGRRGPRPRLLRCPHSGHLPGGPLYMKHVGAQNPAYLIDPSEEDFRPVAGGCGRSHR